MTNSSTRYGRPALNAPAAASSASSRPWSSGSPPVAAAPGTSSTEPRMVPATSAESGDHAPGQPADGGDVEHPGAGVAERQREADGVDAGEAWMDEREHSECDQRDAERVAPRAAVPCGDADRARERDGHGDREGDAVDAEPERRVHADDADRPHGRVPPRPGAKLDDPPHERQEQDQDDGAADQPHQRDAEGRGDREGVHEERHAGEVRNRCADQCHGRAGARGGAHGASNVAVTCIATLPRIAWQTGQCSVASSTSARRSPSGAAEVSRTARSLAREPVIARALAPLEPHLRLGDDVLERDAAPARHARDRRREAVRVRRREQLLRVRGAARAAQLDLRRRRRREQARVARDRAAEALPVDRRACHEAFHRL